MINGRDAELTCEFPRGSHLISNIVWERVGDRNYYSRSVSSMRISFCVFNDVVRSSSLRDSLGRRMEVKFYFNKKKSIVELFLLQVERIGDFGSVLIVRDWNERYYNHMIIEAAITIACYGSQVAKVHQP